VIGVERRAEERFVAILPKGTEALSDTRLLRVGEQENGWRLDAIEEDAGVFSQAGRKRRLNFPGGKP
jgi:type IV secretory pathway VirB9-like protein